MGPDRFAALPGALFGLGFAQMVVTVLTIAVSNRTDSDIEDEVFHQPDTDVVRSQGAMPHRSPASARYCPATLVTRLPTISAATRAPYAS